jgi:hypothetical protein
VYAAEIRFFQNPSHCDIEKLKPKLEMEITDIQSIDTLKDKLKEVILPNF